MVSLYMSPMYEKNVWDRLWFVAALILSFPFGFIMAIRCWDRGKLADSVGEDVGELLLINFGGIVVSFGLVLFLIITVGAITGQIK